MDLETSHIVSIIAVVLSGIGGFAIAKFKRRGEEHDREEDRHKATEKDIQSVKLDVAELKREVEHKPEARELSRLAESVADVRADVSHIKATSDGQRESLVGLGREIGEVRTLLIQALSGEKK